MRYFVALAVFSLTFIFPFIAQAQDNNGRDGEYIFPGLGPVECIESVCSSPSIGEGSVNLSKQVCIASECFIEVSWDYEGIFDSDAACIYMNDDKLDCGETGKYTLPIVPVNQRSSVELRIGDAVLASTNIIGLDDVAKPVTNTTSESVRTDYFKSIAQGGAASSWDGRLFFAYGNEMDANGDEERFLYVRPLELEQLKKNNNGSLNFRKILRNLHLTKLAGEDELGVAPENHLAIFPNPVYKGNPYTSTSTGGPNANGNFLTYNFFGITTIKKEVPFRTDGKKRSVLAMFQAVVVIDPEDNTISHTEIKQQARALTQKNSTEYLWGYEPGVSVDGKLLVYSGNPYPDVRTGNGGMITYSYTQNPLFTGGWSEPKNIADMYEQDGAGAYPETTIGDRKFSDIFPIARHDVVDYNGDPVTAIFGAYPWLSYDASEAFFQTIPGWHGGRRHGATMVGARTHGTLMHVDGDLTLTRGNPTGRTNISTGEVRNEENMYMNAHDRLEKAYRGINYPRRSTQICSDSGTTEPLLSAYNEVLLAPIALYGTSWNPFLDHNAPLLPLSQSDLTYGFVSSAGRKYAEVPIIENKDSLLLYYPMNEPIGYDDYSISRFVEGLEDGDLLSVTNPMPPDGATLFDTRTFNAYVTDEVADYSSYHHTGSLVSNGVQLVKFPYEQCGVDRLWDDASETILDHAPFLDVNNGAIGNSLAFERGGQINTVLSHDATSTLADAKEFTVAFWINRGTPDPSIKGAPTSGNVLNVNGLFSLFLNQQNLILRSPLSLETDNGEDRYLVETEIFDNWNHYAISFKGNTFTIFLNGDKIGHVSALETIDLPQTAELEVNIGPGNALYGTGIQLAGPPPSQTNDDEGQNGGPYSVIQMDEFYFYATGLSQSEISKLAWQKQSVDQSETASNGNFFSVPDIFADLPQKSVNLPTPTDKESAVIELGKALFNSRDLSKDGVTSCASCHKKDNFFADENTKRFSTGVDQSLTKRNTPTLANLLFSEDFFLDGKASSLEEQVLHPMVSNTELGLTEDDSELFERLRINLGEVDDGPDFSDAFGGTEIGTHINYNNIALSLSHYIRSLIFVPEDSALSGPAVKGKEVFEGRGNCIACHSGPNFTDNRFHNIGLDVCSDSTDFGRKNVTSRIDDCGKFKTPTLIGISSTAPYFHDGRASSLDEVIRHYNAGARTDRFTSDLIRPLNLNENDIDNLEAYLESLGNIQP